MSYKKDTCCLLTRKWRTRWVFFPVYKAKIQDMSGERGTMVTWVHIPHVEDQCITPMINHLACSGQGSIKGTHHHPAPTPFCVCVFLCCCLVVVFCYNL